jgi:superfamily II DNA helicase RecQ
VRPVEVDRNGQGTPLQSQTSATAQQAEQVPLGEGEPSEEAVLKLPMSEEVQAAINLARSEGGSAEGLREVLRSVFRHEDFRGQQLGIIQEVLQGQSTLAILPTGRSLASPNPRQLGILSNSNG